VNTTTATPSASNAIQPPGADFVRTFGDVQLQAHSINRLNGWWDDREAYLASGLPNAHANTVCALVGLAHTELSETIEAARKHPMQTWADPKTKDTMVRELAGTVVRVMDLAQAFGLPLAEAILAELNANAARGFRHGGKAA
jgi:ABC-type Fe3+ transport system substrate-binding protein